MVAIGMGTKGAVERAMVGAHAHQARLHKIVLCWDYLHLLRDSKVKQKNRKAGDGNDGVVLKKVSNTFKDNIDYLSVFEPLLFEEIKAQIVRGQEEEETMEYQMAAVASCERANEFYTVRIAVKAEVAQEFAENDLLLLSKEKFQEGSDLPSTHAFAMVEGREGRTILKLRMFLDGEVNQLNVERISPCSRLSKMIAALQ